MGGGGREESQAHEIRARARERDFFGGEKTRRIKLEEKYDRGTDDIKRKGGVTPALQKILYQQRQDRAVRVGEGSRGVRESGALDARAHTLFTHAAHTRRPVNKRAALCLCRARRLA